MPHKSNQILCILMPTDINKIQKIKAPNPNCKHINFNLDYVSFFDYIRENHPHQKFCPVCKLYRFEAEYKEYSLNANQT